MVNIKKNNDGKFLEASGKRKLAKFIYTPGQNQPFAISRTKFSNFLDCKRCFYLDRVKGLIEPGGPGWALNTTVDELLKKEFDFYREKKEPHPIFKKYKLNFIPYQHQDLERWREARSAGISYHNKDTNLIIKGGIDDVWFNLDTKELVVADYKAQSKKEKVEKQSYLEDKYHQDYKKQMEIYVHILQNMGFDVSTTTYFMVCNGIKTGSRFDAKMDFDITLIDYEVDIDWIPSKITEMKNTLDSAEVPEANPYCENCAYLRVGGSF